MSRSEKIILKYFKFFEEKKIDNISFLLAEDIRLIDWENSFSGKKKVLEEIKRIFSESKKIKLEILRINSTDLINYCEIKIKLYLDDNAVVDVEVMDVIELNSDFLISNIKAYKG